MRPSWPRRWGRLRNPDGAKRHRGPRSPRECRGPAPGKPRSPILVLFYDQAGPRLGAIARSSKCCRWHYAVRQDHKRGDRSPTMTDILSGIKIPDSKIAREAAELVRQHESELLFNHSVRVFLF